MPYGPDPDMKGNPFASAVCTPGNGGNKVKKFECDYTQRSEWISFSDFEIREI